MNVRVRMQRTLRLIEDGFLVLLLAVVVVLASAQIVLRNFLDISLLWIDPLLRVVVLWIAFVGAVVATRERRHIAIGVGEHLMVTAAGRSLARLSNLVTAVICAVAGWYSGVFVAREFEDGFAAFDAVPAWLCEAMIPVGFTLIAVRYLSSALLPGSEPPAERP